MGCGAWLIVGAKVGGIKGKGISKAPEGATFFLHFLSI
jgi:hypothetical protein